MDNRRWIYLFYFTDGRDIMDYIHLLNAVLLCSSKNPVSGKILSSTTVFNINKKCFMSSKSSYWNDF